MEYQKIWNKVLSTDEEVKYEFSLGKRYRMLGLIVWGVLSLLLLPVGGLGLFTFLIASFYYGYYLKVANAYAFTNKRVLVHTGWLSTNLVSVDYEKVSDVHVNEPLLDRLVTKTGNLAINTPGSSQKEIVLMHIEAPYETKKRFDEIRNV